MNVYEFTISKEWNDNTIKSFLRREKQVSSTLLKLLKNQEGALLKNKEPVRTIDRVQEGDVISFQLPEETCSLLPSNKTVEVVYEDREAIVFFKPAGMVTHPSFLHPKDTLGNVYASHIQKQGVNTLFRPMNRLDRNTSGLVLAAKNLYSAYWLKSNMKKKYMAVISGHLKEKSGVIDLPIGRKPDSIIERKVTSEGQRAITCYQVIKELKGYSIVEISLKTGRTHQIRVHFAHIGHPLLGDDLYGGDHNYLKRQALTCTEIEFTNIIHSEMHKISAFFEQDIQNAIETIGNMQS